jgi:hypothetical protein
VLLWTEVKLALKNHRKRYSRESITVEEEAITEAKFSMEVAAVMTEAMMMTIIIPMTTGGVEKMKAGCDRYFPRITANMPFRLSLMNGPVRSAVFLLGLVL